MKEINVKNAAVLMDVICLLLGEEICKETKLSHAYMGKILGAEVESYFFTAKDPNNNCVVDFHFYGNDAQVFVLAFDEDYVINVSTFKEDDHMNMCIIDLIFDFLTEEEIKNAVDLIVDAEEVVVEEDVLLQ